MIKAEIRPSQKASGQQSVFVSFPYTVERVAKVKSLETRYYIPETKEWEVPASLMEDVLNVFKPEEVVVKGGQTTPQPVQPRIPMASMVSDFPFKTEPFQHQIEGFNYGLANRKFLLGDEQGLGKTKQSIDIAVARKAEMKYTLIVCGVNSVKYNWVREINIHSNEKSHVLGMTVDKRGKVKDGGIKERINDLNRNLDAYFLITNIETLRNKDIQQQVLKMTKDGTIGLVIIDEIHKAKNPTSQQGKAIHYLQSKYKIALTGTPVMNQAIDLYNVMKWLDVENHTYYQFKNRYCVMGGYQNYQIVGYRNMDELRSRVEKFMLRRKKEEVLNLPPKIRQKEYVDMTAKQAQLYKEVQLFLADSLNDIELSTNPLAQLIRLRQVTSHPSIISELEESAKFDRMEEIIEELTESGKKAVIFSNWESVTDIAKKRLSKYNPAYITGSVVDRQAEVEKFQNNPSCQVVIGTIGAMGTGLTLTAGSTVIFLDKAWNMANTEQAEDRCHRIGTTGTVNVITLICNGTIDEYIEDIIESKAELADALVDGNATFNKAKQMEIVREILGVM
jgi:SNF2 family DNA or RNA helicase